MLEQVSTTLLQPILSQAAAAIVGRLAIPCLAVRPGPIVAFVNPALQQLLGIEPATLTGRPLFAVADGLFDQPALRDLLDASGGTFREVQGLPLEFALPDGERRVVTLTVVRVRADRFETELTILALEDQTDRTVLAEAWGRLATAVEQAADGIAVTDRTGIFVYANPAFARIAGYPAAQLVGREARALLRDDLVPVRPEIAEEILSGRSWSGTLTVRQRDGSSRILDATVAPVADPVGLGGYVVVARDVTTERLVEAELQREVRDRAAVAASFARLRPGASPEATAARLCTELRRQPAFDLVSILVLAGRAGVVALATRPASAAFRPNGPLGVATSSYLRRRAVGGIWVEPCTEDVASVYGRAWATDGMRTVATVPLRGEHGLVGFLAVGSTTRDADGLLAEMPTLLEFSTLAMALLDGALSDRREATARQQTIWDLVARRAFDPVFQPIVELASGRTVGYEALTRFHDGTAPAEQFAAAREAGLFTVLDRACLASALRSARELPEDAWLSLNVSADAILTGSRLGQTLAEVPRAIVLEITEHAFVSDPAAVRAAVARLGDGQREIRLAMDDAGAGYAGLRFILELKPDLIKLDLGLTADIERDPVKQALVAGMRHFANQLGACLIAEGIETPEGLAEIRSLGVPYGQGYLWGRPAPADAWAAALPGVTHAADRARRMRTSGQPREPMPVLAHANNDGS